MHLWLPWYDLRHLNSNTEKTEKNLKNPRKKAFENIVEKAENE